MRDEEIQRRIASFPQWHYRFDLRGNPTPIPNENWALRHPQRKRYFFDPLVELLGGSLEGKRVLDLGCNAGYWSLCAVQSGCEFVQGIDGRQMHVDQANLVFRVKGVDETRYSFVAGDIFETDLRRFGSFDVVLCLGLMYHISKHMDLMERIDEVNADVLVVDTVVSRAKGSFLELRRERRDDPRNSVDHDLVMFPTRQAMRDLAENFGYSVAMLKPDFRDERGEPEWRAGTDYRDDRRRAFLCAKQTDLSRLDVEVEPIESDET